MWKLGDDGNLLNKLRQWPYYFRNTTIPKVGTSGLIKVEDGGINKILTFHNFTKGLELFEDVSSLENYYMWQWKVEAADVDGWSKIKNPDPHSAAKWPSRRRKPQNRNKTRVLACFWFLGAPSKFPEEYLVVWAETYY